MSNNPLTNFKIGDIVYNIDYRRFYQVIDQTKDMLLISDNKFCDAEYKDKCLKITDNDLLEILYGRS